MPDPQMNAGDVHRRLDRLLGDGIAIDREPGCGGMARVFLATEQAPDRRIEGAHAQVADFRVAKALPTPASTRRRPRLDWR